MKIAFVHPFNKIMFYGDAELFDNGVMVITPHPDQDGVNETRIIIGKDEIRWMSLEPPKEHRVLISGDRDWDNFEKIEEELKKYDPSTTVVIHGAARGADTIAGHVAKRMGMRVMEFPADWNQYGRAAGHIRNKHMLDEGKPDELIAFHSDILNSKGTKNMIEQARDRGLPIRLVA